MSTENLTKAMQMYMNCTNFLNDLDSLPLRMRDKDFLETCGKLTKYRNKALKKISEILNNAISESEIKPEGLAQVARARAKEIMGINNIHLIATEDLYTRCFIEGTEWKEIEFKKRIDTAFENWKQFSGEKQQGIAYGLNLALELYNKKS